MYEYMYIYVWVVCMCVCMFMYTYENCIWKKKHWNKINEKNSENENLQHIIFINMCVCIKQHILYKGMYQAARYVCVWYSTRVT